MIQIKKTTVWKALGGLGLLAAVMVAALLFAPAVGAQYSACGDGYCNTSTENTDTCMADCPCTDNGVADPGEGCGCRDVVCEDEKITSACGTLCDVTGECPEGLSCFEGVCWEDCACEGICDEEEEMPAPAVCLEIEEFCESDEECCSGFCHGIGEEWAHCCIGD